MFQIFKKLIIAILIIFVIRILLFSNLPVWEYYYDSLYFSDLGFRQRSLIKTQTNDYVLRKNPMEVDILAVGSSQVRQIFLSHSREELISKLEVFTVSGFGPIDLMLFRNNIKTFNASTIILYMSEFDLGRLLWERYPLSPSQGFYFLDLYKRITKHSFDNSAKQMLKNLFIDEFFPERKYSFIFKGLLNKALGGDIVKKSKSKNENKKKTVIQGQIRRISDLSEKAINFNVKFLEDFINLYKYNGTKIIILEGQYNPKSYTKEKLVLKNKSREIMQKLSNKYEHVRFIPESELFIFEVEDFIDLLHVNEKAARLFRSYLFLKLDTL